MKPFLHFVARVRQLVCDGAMGTELMLAGLEQGSCGEAWNLTAPERVLAIQKRYVAAGADCVITNTFGASRIGLARHGREADLTAINRAGAQIARAAFGGRPGFVLGDVGPTGELIEPYGELSMEAANAAFTEQASVLVESGVDAIIIETQTSLEELGVALEAAQAAKAPCIIASLAYDVSPDGKSFHTMMGVSPEAAVCFAEERGAHILALNCGRGMDMPSAAAVTRLYRIESELPIMVQPNAGQPVLEGGRLVYHQSPTEMARAVPEALDAGAAIIGSCCGSTPEHTAAIRRAVNQWIAKH